MSNKRAERWPVRPSTVGLLLLTVIAVVAVVLALHRTAGQDGGGQIADLPASSSPPPTSADAKSLKAVAMGDSITAGIIAGPGDSYPSPPDKPGAIAWVRYCTAARFTYDAGIPGDTTAAMLGRFQRDVLSRHPRVVVILGGTNDLYNHATPKVIVQNLSTMVDQARAAGIVPLLATVPPRDDMPAAAAALNRAIRAYARAESLHLIDFYAVTVDRSTGKWRSGYTSDGVHPTVLGARRMAAAADRALAQV